MDEEEIEEKEEKKVKKSTEDKEPQLTDLPGIGPAVFQLEWLAFLSNALGSNPPELARFWNGLPLQERPYKLREKY